jgi:hypothetical protein
MTLVPFAEDLNRFILKLNGAEQGSYKITWGSESKEFTGEQLSAGIFLAKEFPENPFCAAFDKVDAAVFAKQQYETTQVKQIFNGAEGKADFSKAMAETEAVRKPLADAIAAAVVPVTHSIQIEKLK